MQGKLSAGMTLPQSAYARRVLDQLTVLQEEFRDGLNNLSQEILISQSDLAKSNETVQLLSKTSWLRDEGQHGGGWRWGTVDQGILNRGSLNISSVHYDDLPDKKLASATALSCIVHPSSPVAPSLHTHISWTEMRNGKGGGWRLMADLNPSTPFESDRKYFIQEIDLALSSLPKGWLEYAKAQGDRYFKIPVLNRHRGVAHYYVEQWKSGDNEADLALAIKFGKKVIQTYLEIIAQAFRDHQKRDVNAEQQLAYHTTYFLQVLTLDRGTSSGLLVHQQNDVGIMGSLPQRVSPSLLKSWIGLLPQPQDKLLTHLIAVLPPANNVIGDLESCEVTNETRLALAQVVRTHYQEHPEALALQARGDILPPTVANHSSESNDIAKSI